jgi:ADP-ribose pyrophosphatase
MTRFQGSLKYRGKFIQVTEEVIGEQTWERAYIPNGVIVFPVTGEGKLLFVEEKRPHENPPIRLKPLAGMIENHETPEENAQREMQEEIGLAARSMECFFTITSTGTVNATQYFFLAKGLTVSKLPNPDGEDIILDVKEFSLEELIDMLETEKLRWSTSVLGIWRLWQLVQKKKISLI